MTSEKKMTEFRIEKDSLGNVKVPKTKYWGAQTQRSLENFKIGNDKIPLIIIKSFAIQKKAATISNLAIGKLETKIGQAIIKVCDEIISGKLDEHFPLSVWQTGSGTQTNMNLNEVIANKANTDLGQKLGEYNPIHPNDHCNLGQSSNDSFPTAMHISIIKLTNEELVPSISKMIKILEKKEREFKNIIKVGRTHLQDATPITLNQEFGGFKSQIKSSLKRILNSYDELLYLAQGGTAVGTGLNTSTKFIKGFIKAIQMITGIEFRESKNKFESISSHEPIIFFTSAINTLVIACYKIANDIRLLSSGPRCGIGELILPSNEPGSSIMPGKVNPTQCEAITMVCAKVIGNNSGITIAGSHGHFELNVFKPLIAHNILQSIEILSDSSSNFANFCIKGIRVNKKRVKELLENSLMLVTALTPKIGYDKAAKIAKNALKNNTSLRFETIKSGLISEKDYDKIVNPKKMIYPS